MPPLNCPNTCFVTAAIPREGPSPMSNAITTGRHTYTVPENIACNFNVLGSLRQSDTVRDFGPNWYRTVLEPSTAIRPIREVIHLLLESYWNGRVRSALRVSSENLPARFEERQRPPPGLPLSTSTSDHSKPSSISVPTCATWVGFVIHIFNLWPPSLNP